MTVIDPGIYMPDLHFLQNISSMQIAYASQRSNISFYIYGFQARLSDFFFQFQAFLPVCCRCPVFDCQVFVQKQGWK